MYSNVNRAGKIFPARCAGRKRQRRYFHYAPVCIKKGRLYRSGKVFFIVPRLFFAVKHGGCL